MRAKIRLIMASGSDLLTTEYERDEVDDILNAMFISSKSRFFRFPEGRMRLINMDHVVIALVEPVT